MRCPYRVMITHQDREEGEYTYRPQREIEEYPQCYHEECPFYEEHNVCKNVKAEVGLIDG